MNDIQDTNIKKMLQDMNRTENQGGDLKSGDYIIYVALGVVFPLVLLIWGWF